MCLLETHEAGIINVTVFLSALCPIRRSPGAVTHGAVITYDKCVLVTFWMACLRRRVGKRHPFQKHARCGWLVHHRRTQI